MTPIFLILVLPVLVGLAMWGIGRLFDDKPAKPTKTKVDLSYNPLAQEFDVNIPHYPGQTPEDRQHMYDVLTGAKPPGPDDRLVTIEGSEIERILTEAGAPRKPPES